MGHSYGTTFPTDKMLYVRRQLEQEMQTHSGKEFWMTEYCICEHNEEVVGEGRDIDSMACALYVARVIHYDFTLAQASAWQWWLAISPYDYKDGLVYVDKEQSGTYHQSKTLWALGNFSRFIRPGAQRVAVAGHDVQDQANCAGLMVSAYVHDARREVVVVFVNYGHAPQHAQVQVEGAPVEHFVCYTTNCDNNLQPGPQVPAGCRYVIPDRSICTFVGVF